MGASDERREGRTRLVAGAGLVVTAECAIWRIDADTPTTKQVLEVLERAGARNIWLRDDVFDRIALEQGIRPDGLPRVMFVYRAWAYIRRRSERPSVLEMPAIFECGCSRHKVAAGLCDSYGPDGRLRT